MGIKPSWLVKRLALALIPVVLLVEVVVVVVVYVGGKWKPHNDCHECTLCAMFLLSDHIGPEISQ